MLRAIARLNVGGPAIQAIALTRHLDPSRFDSLLATGRCADGEVEMTDFLRRSGVRPVRIPGLGRAIRPGDDARALLALVRLMRRFRPHVVHTHTAKAGALGRLAAAVTRVPVRVHTYHGHVFRGYFSRTGSTAVVVAERMLGRLTDRVIAISEGQRDEICDVFRVASRRRMTVIPLGFDLAPFLALEPGARDGGVRREIGAAPDDVVVAIVGRVAPVKQHALFLEAFAAALREAPALRAVVVGDGPPADVAALEARAAALRVAARVHFLGYRTALAAVYADADVVALSSANEGTPVALIEALAAGVPCVATRVGGVPEVLDDGRCGVLVPPGDADALARGLAALAMDPGRRTALGERGRRFVRERYERARLVRDVEDLYDGLCGRPRADRRAPLRPAPASPSAAS